MYLHLGQNTVIRQDTVLGIFDLENTSQSHITRAFLRQAEKDGRVINVSEDIPKSFVVCEEDGRWVVYLSQLASSTLLRRSENFLDSFS